VAVDDGEVVQACEQDPVFAQRSVGTSHDHVDWVDSLAGLQTIDDCLRAWRNAPDQHGSVLSVCLRVMEDGEIDLLQLLGIPPPVRFAEVEDGVIKSRLSVLEEVSHGEADGRGHQRHRGEDIVIPLPKKPPQLRLGVDYASVFLQELSDEQTDFAEMFVRSPEFEAMGKGMPGLPIAV
jgi:hypothetical protein